MQLALALNDEGSATTRRGANASAAQSSTVRSSRRVASRSSAGSFAEAAVLESRAEALLALLECVGVPRTCGANRSRGGQAWPGGAPRATVRFPARWSRRSAASTCEKCPPSYVKLAEILCSPRPRTCKKCAVAQNLTAPGH